jgi:hypothetical protein
MLTFQHFPRHMDVPPKSTTQVDDFGARRKSHFRRSVG